MSTYWAWTCASIFSCVCARAHVYSRRASFHIKLGGYDALLVEYSSHLVHLATFHRPHQPVVILIPVCVLTNRIENYQLYNMVDSIYLIKVDRKIPIIDFQHCCNSSETPMDIMTMKRFLFIVHIHIN